MATPDLADSHRMMMMMMLMGGARVGKVTCVWSEQVVTEQVNGKRVKGI